MDRSIEIKSGKLIYLAFEQINATGKSYVKIGRKAAKHLQLCQVRYIFIVLDLTNLSLGHFLMALTVQSTRYLPVIGLKLVLRFMRASIA
jgi:hypothetical protein